MTRALALVLVVGCSSPDLAHSDVGVFTHIDVDHATVDVIGGRAPCFVGDNGVTVSYGGSPMKLVMLGGEDSDTCQPVEFRVALDGSALASSDVIVSDDSATLTAAFPDGQLQAPRVTLSTKTLVEGEVVHASWSPVVDLAGVSHVQLAFVFASGFGGWEADGVVSGQDVTCTVPETGITLADGPGNLYVSTMPALQGSPMTCDASECGYDIAPDVFVPNVTTAAP